MGDMADDWLWSQEMSYYYADQPQFNGPWNTMTRADQEHFEKTLVWTTADGGRVRIYQDMADSHLLNLERWLRGRGRTQPKMHDWDREIFHQVVLAEIRRRSAASKKAPGKVDQRAFFAGLAMQAFIPLGSQQLMLDREAVVFLARAAYFVADAMLEERDRVVDDDGA